MFDVAGADFLGQLRVGVAVLDGVGSLGVLLSRKEARAQETYGLGITSCVASPSLVAGAGLGDRRR